MTDHPLTPPEDLLQQMTNPYRAICAELVDELTRAANGLSNRTANANHRALWAKDAYQAADRARALLAQPPSLKEQALAVLDHTQKGYGLAEVDLDTIRRALEALDD
jgi:hypothetical protein